MDGTLGSQTALMTDVTGVEITSREEPADRPQGGPGALAGRGSRDGDLANKNALMHEETKDEWRRRPAAPHRAHPVPAAR